MLSFAISKAKSRATWISRSTPSTTTAPRGVPASHKHLFSLKPSNSRRSIPPNRRKRRCSFSSIQAIAIASQSTGPYPCQRIIIHIHFKPHMRFTLVSFTSLSEPEGTEKSPAKKNTHRMPAHHAIGLVVGFMRYIVESPNSASALCTLCIFFLSPPAFRVTSPLCFGAGIFTEARWRLFHSLGYLCHSVILRACLSSTQARVTIMLPCCVACHVVRSAACAVFMQL